MTMRPPRLPVRVCSIHGLASGPDGKCVLCQRSGGTSSSGGASPWRAVAALAVACAAIVGGAVYWKRADRRPAPAGDLVRPPPRSAQTATEAEAEDARDLVEEKTQKARRRIVQEQQRQGGIAGEMKNVKIVMYTTKPCDLCDAAREWLGREHLAFQEIDVGKDAAALEAMHKLTPSNEVPVFQVDDEVLVGFGPTNVAGAVRRAADKRAR